MHELAISQALLDAVDTHVAAHEGVRPVCIRIRIGPLSGVVPELLQQAYGLARAGTVAQDAELVIESAAVRVHCSSCDRESDARPNRLVCAHCGNWRTRLLSGDELVLQSIELEKLSGSHTAAA